MVKEHHKRPDARDDHAAITVEGLVNRFGSHVVHEDLDLTLQRGEILGVVGGSGTGKSVLLRSIVGLKKPNGGRIDVLGNRLDELSDAERSRVERRFGVLFQRGALFSSLTLQENVALPSSSTPNCPEKKPSTWRVSSWRWSACPRRRRDSSPSRCRGAWSSAPRWLAPGPGP